MAVQQGRSEQGGEAYSILYVEPLSDARTPLADFFSILLTRLLCQDVESQLVTLAVEVFEQGVFEEGVIRSRGHEQGHAGPEFQIVGVGEDLLSATTVHIKHKLRTGSEPGAEGRMLQIGLGLIE